MIGKERRSSESLCEKSMLLLANLIKLSSSISFANTANEATAGTSATRERSGGNSAATPLIPGSRRLQEPQSRAKPIYVTKPGGGSFQISHGSPRYSPSSSSSSSNVIPGESDCDEANVDGWASKYIERVHRNRKDFDQYPTNEKPYSMGKNRLRTATSYGLARINP
ncbi:uncharacterized protein LOC111431459 [Cucurbita moschata]|uniref:Uncharacterized protein LOC111431459 n=1 Tax=Cucurbita moschata TaxID=3662 RepID=A0A6J1E7B0_CUCMO|nr:uncharacterized protein LOC111431459 [Cucurbita moschata]